MLGHAGNSPVLRARHRNLLNIGKCGTMKVSICRSRAASHHDLSMYANTTERLPPFCAYVNWKGTNTKRCQGPYMTAEQDGSERKQSCRPHLPQPAGRYRFIDISSIHGSRSPALVADRWPPVVSLLHCTQPKKTECTFHRLNERVRRLNTGKQACHASCMRSCTNIGCVPRLESYVMYSPH